MTQKSNYIPAPDKNKYFKPALKQRQMGFTAIDKMRETQIAYNVAMAKLDHLYVKDPRRNVKITTTERGMKEFQKAMEEEASKIILNSRWGIVKMVQRNRRKHKSASKRIALQWKLFAEMQAQQKDLTNYNI